MCNLSSPHFDLCVGYAHPFFFCWQRVTLDEPKSLEKDLASVLRSHGVSLGVAQDVLGKVMSSYSQFSADLTDGEEERLLVIFKQVLYLAIFAHAPPVPGQAPRSIWHGFG